MRIRALLPLWLVLLFIFGVGVDPGQARPVDLAAYRFDPLVEQPRIPAELSVAPDAMGAYGYYLVQCGAPITAAWQARLEEAGATLYGSLPEFVLLAGMDPETLGSVRALPGIEWIGAFHPAFKLAPGIGERVYLSPERAQRDDLRLIVRIFDDPEGVGDRITALGCSILEYTDDGFARRFRIDAPRDVLSKLARIPQVWWIEEQPEFFTANSTTCWVVQSNVSGWTPLWDQGLHGEGQIVTIMDSGVDYNSCWFRETGNAAPGPAHRKIIDYSLAGGAAYDGCDLGHGSHVAGTICGDQSYINPGNYAYNGMAYKAKLTVQDVGADDWTACNIGTVNVPASLTASFTSSYNLGARVHSNSWGSTANEYDSYSVDVDNTMWNHKDYLVCFAAGNSGSSANTVGSPGTAKNCITVGACEQSPSQDLVASYSSRGPASSTDSRYKPTLMAPGGEDNNYIRSVDNNTGNPPSPTCQTAWDPFKGTSMATPCVSGMALNVRQYYVDGFYPMGAAGGDEPFTPSAALIKASLVASTKDMGTANIPNNNEGWGRLLVDNSLYFEGDTREAMVFDETPGLTTGGSWSMDIEIESGSEPLHATLVWTDYPGTSGSGVKLINDLDLVVTPPAGSAYLGNVFSAGWSATGGVNDRRNVEECVRVNNPAAGIWHVAVSGYNIPHGPQPFAMVVNGAFADWPPEAFSETETTGGRGAIRALVMAFPNPATGMTSLQYAVPTGYAGPVELSILDVSGRVVRRLVSKGQSAGIYGVTWDRLDDLGRRVDAGVYFARMTAGQVETSGRVVLSE